MVWLIATGSVYTCGATPSGIHHTAALVTGLPANDPAVAISAGNAYATALLQDGQIWDWGLGGAGQLGDGSFASSSVPVQVQLPTGTYATQVYSGGDLGNDGHQLAVLNTGAVVSWGSNLCGQLGSRQPSRSAPSPVTIIGNMTVSRVAAGGAQSFVIDSSGNLWAWGQDHGGQVRSPAKSCVFHLNKIDTGVDMISATASDVIDHHS